MSEQNWHEALARAAETVGDQEDDDAQARRIWEEARGRGTRRRFSVVAGVAAAGLIGAFAVAFPLGGGGEGSPSSVTSSPIPRGEEDVDVSLEAGTQLAIVLFSRTDDGVDLADLQVVADLQDLSGEPWRFMDTSALYSTGQGGFITPERIDWGATGANGFRPVAESAGLTWDSAGLVVTTCHARARIPVVLENGRLVPTGVWQELATTSDGGCGPDIESSLWGDLESISSLLDQRPSLARAGGVLALVASVPADDNSFYGEASTPASVAFVRSGQSAPESGQPSAASMEELLGEWEEVPADEAGRLLGDSDRSFVNSVDGLTSTATVQQNWISFTGCNGSGGPLLGLLNGPASSGRRSVAVVTESASTSMGCSDGTEGQDDFFTRAFALGAGLQLRGDYMILDTWVPSGQLPEASAEKGKEISIAYVREGVDPAVAPPATVSAETLEGQWREITAEHAREVLAAAGREFVSLTPDDVGRIRVSQGVVTITTDCNEHQLRFAQVREGSPRSDGPTAILAGEASTTEMLCHEASQRVDAFWAGQLDRTPSLTVQVWGDYLIVDTQVSQEWWQKRDDEGVP